jgi:hypothetical protein
MDTRLKKCCAVHLRSLVFIGVLVSLAFLVTSNSALSQASRTHALTPGQVQAIISAAMAWQANVIVPQVEKPKPGPMRALRASDGSIEFCAFVYTGHRNLFGTINRQFVFGTFPSATSTSVVARRQFGDGLGIHDECRRKGIGIL